ncbi:MAG: endonuclease/exonuclease/phosphatase family protein [Paludibacteraceae bacterium]|nr:endonuclease/exonuclease/phosphatase family protein [Paludibacteraceae bacterium]
MMAKKKKHIKRIVLLVLLVPIVLVGVWAALLLFSHGSPTDEYSHHLSVLTYNTHQMGQYEKAYQNRVIRYLQRQDADIICLQEVDVYKNDKYLTLPELRKALEKYPYTYFDFKIYNKRHQYGLAVFSKYPLSNKNTIRYSSRGNISDYCDVAVGKDTFRLFNNHLESNRLVVKDLPDSIESAALKESVQRISDKLESARKIRQVQAKAIRAEIEKSPYPVIVAGDFNVTPLSYTYLKIRGGELRDCFLATSWGKWGATVVKRHLGVRIDYLLCSRALHPVETHIDRINCSDHYPVTTTIGW